MKRLIIDRGLLMGASLAYAWMMWLFLVVLPLAPGPHDRNGEFKLMAADTLGLTIGFVVVCLFGSLTRFEKRVKALKHEPETPNFGYLWTTLVTIFGGNLLTYYYHLNVDVMLGAVCALIVIAFVFTTWRDATLYRAGEPLRDKDVSVN